MPPHLLAVLVTRFPRVSFFQSAWQACFVEARAWAGDSCLLKAAVSASFKERASHGLKQLVYVCMCVCAILNVILQGTAGM